jgi:hypothetical protein
MCAAENFNSILPIPIRNKVWARSTLEQPRDVGDDVQKCCRDCLNIAGSEKVAGRASEGGDTREEETHGSGLDDGASDSVVAAAPVLPGRGVDDAPVWVHRFGPHSR